MIGLGAALLLMGAAALASVRLFVGPTLYDRALAAHAVILLAALAAAALGAGMARASIVDTAIALVFSDLVLAAAVLKFFRFRSLQPPLARPRGEDGP